jgi:hypothetical protein
MKREFFGFGGRLPGVIAFMKQSDGSRHLAAVKLFTVEQGSFHAEF